MAYTKIFQLCKSYYVCNILLLTTVFSTAFKEQITTDNNW